MSLAHDEGKCHCPGHGMEHREAEIGAVVLLRISQELENRSSGCSPENGNLLRSDVELISEDSHGKAITDYAASRQKGLGQTQEGSDHHLSHLQKTEARLIIEATRRYVPQGRLWQRLRPVQEPGSFESRFR